MKFKNITLLIVFCLLVSSPTNVLYADDAVTKILDKAQELAEKKKIKGKNLSEFITNNVITVDYEGEERSYKFNTDVTYEVYVEGKIVEQGTWAIKGLTKKSIKLTGHQDLYIQIYKNKDRISTLTNLKKKNDSQTNRKILKISSSSDFDKQLAQIKPEKEKALEEKTKEEKQKTLEQKKKELEERKQRLAEKRKALEKKKGKIEVGEEKKEINKQVKKRTSEQFVALQNSKYITFDEFKFLFDGNIIEVNFLSPPFDKSQKGRAIFKVDMSKYKNPDLYTDFYWSTGNDWHIIEGYPVPIFVEPTPDGKVKKVYLCDQVLKMVCEPGGMVSFFHQIGYDSYLTILYTKQGEYVFTPTPKVLKGDISYSNNRITFRSQEYDRPYMSITTHLDNKIIDKIENDCKTGSKKCERIKW
tara:strand:+ start:278 stop:1522 length:1245 start_codon:yes stop_codon:yes gene_type:complete